jgi:hypothetical protein
MEERVLEHRLGCASRFSIPFFGCRRPGGDEAHRLARVAGLGKDITPLAITATNPLTHSALSLDSSSEVA